MLSPSRSRGPAHSPRLRPAPSSPFKRLLSMATEKCPLLAIELSFSRCRVAVDSRRLIEDLQRTATERDAVLPIPLRASSRNAPHSLVPVDLCPRSSTDLAGACRRQDQELQRQLQHRPCVRRPDRPECRRHFAVRQRPHVPHGVPLRSEHGTDPVARVVGPKIHRHGPFQDRADALAQLPGRGCLLVPDRSEDPDHVGARHLRNRHLPDVREGVVLHARQPELCMSGGAPARREVAAAYSSVNRFIRHPRELMP